MGGQFVMLFSSWCSLPFVQVNFGIFLHVMRRDVRCMQDLQNLIFGGLTLSSILLIHDTIIIHCISPESTREDLLLTTLGIFTWDSLLRLHVINSYACVL